MCWRRVCGSRCVMHDVTDVNVVATLNAAGQPWPDALIDFGDLLRTWLAADVAVAGVSLIGHDPDDALGVIANVLRGYHSVLPLTEDEIAALWPLVVARAASNVASSEHQARLEPDDEYVQGSVEDDWLIWRAVRAVPWRAAHGVLAEAVGMATPTLPMPPRPSGALVALPTDVPSVDQSVTADTFDPERWNLTDGVVGQLRDGWGVGRYDEGRLAPVGDGGVSTGVEIFAPAGTAVMAPASGRLSRLDDHSAALSLDDTWRLVLGGLDVRRRRRIGGGRRPARRRRPRRPTGRRASPCSWWPTSTTVHRCWRRAPAAGGTPPPTRRTGGRREPVPAVLPVGVSDADAAVAPPRRRARPCAGALLRGPAADRARAAAPHVRHRRTSVRRHGEQRDHPRPQPPGGRAGSQPTAAADQHQLPLPLRVDGRVLRATRRRCCPTRSTPSSWSARAARRTRWRCG